MQKVEIVQTLFWDTYFYIFYSGLGVISFKRIFRMQGIYLAKIFQPINKRAKKVDWYSLQKVPFIISINQVQWNCDVKNLTLRVVSQNPILKQKVINSKFEDSQSIVDNKRR